MKFDMLIDSPSIYQMEKELLKTDKRRRSNNTTNIDFRQYFQLRKYSKYKDFPSTLTEYSEGLQNSE